MCVRAYGRRVSVVGVCVRVVSASWEGGNKHHRPLESLIPLEEEERPSNIRMAYG